MDTISGASVIERGIFDPRHTNEAAVFAAWACIVALIYWKLATKHQSGTQFKVRLTMLHSIVSAEATAQTLPNRRSQMSCPCNL